MSLFLTGMIIGVVIGTLTGIILIAVLSANRFEEEQMEKDTDGNNPQ